MKSHSSHSVTAVTVSLLSNPSRPASTSRRFDVLTAVPAPPEALTVPEVMHALRLSRSKIYDLIRSKQLQSFTVGRARRVPVEAVRQYMQDQLREAA